MSSVIASSTSTALSSETFTSSKPIKTSSIKIVAIFFSLWPERIDPLAKQPQSARCERHRPAAHCHVVSHAVMRLGGIFEQEICHRASALRSQRRSFCLKLALSLWYDRTAFSAENHGPFQYERHDGPRDGTLLILRGGNGCSRVLPLILRTSLAREVSDLPGPTHAGENLLPRNNKEVAEQGKLR